MSRGFERGVFAMVVTILLALLAWAHFERMAAERARASAGTELIQARIEAAGLQATIATERTRFEDLLADTTSALQGVIRSLRTAGARSASLATVTVRASGDTLTPAVVHPEASQGPPATDSPVTPDSLSSAVEDGPLTASVRCSLLRPTCRWRWSVTASGRILQVVTPDGRLITTAEALDPRVTFEIPEVVWVPPATGGPWWVWPAVAALGLLLILK